MCWLRVKGALLFLKEKLRKERCLLPETDALTDQ